MPLNLLRGSGGSAAFDLPVIGPITGPAAGVAWKLYETSAQLSFLEQTVTRWENLRWKPMESPMMSGDQFVFLSWLLLVDDA